MESQAGPDGTYTAERVVLDGHMITGCGPGGAAEFSAAVISYMKGKEAAQNIMKATLQPGY
jgi:putative intracellular protease/amidase